MSRAGAAFGALAISLLCAAAVAGCDSSTDKTPGAALTRADIREAAEREGLGRVAEEIAAMAEPAAVLLPGEEMAGDRVGGSRLGGLPDLPRDVPWPQSTEGPLIFLGQVRLDEVRSTGADGLPDAGLLSFFADISPVGDLFGEDSRPGARLQARIFAVDDLEGPREPPPALADALRLRERPVKVERRLDIPDGDSTSEPPEPLAALDLSNEELDRYMRMRLRLHAAYGPGSKAVHKVLGFPDYVQEDPRGHLNDDAEDAGARAELKERGPWRLLFQLSWDPDGLGFDVGDRGALFVLGRARDLARGELDRLTFEIQSN